MVRIFLWLFVGVFLCQSCNTAKRHVRLGNKRFSKGEFEFASQHYKTALAKGEKTPEVYYATAESYRKSNRLQEAGPFYKQAMEAGIKKDTAFFFYAVYLKSLGEYENAKSAYSAYLKSGSTVDFVRKAKREIAFLENIKSLLMKDVPFKVKNAQSINTEFSEYSPAKWNDKIIFATDKSADKIYKTTGRGFYSMFQFKPDGFEAGSGAVSEFQYLPEKESGVHMAGAAFTKDGNTMVFVKSNNGSRKGSHGGTVEETDLYLSTFENGKWSTPISLTVNLPGSWESTPCFSADDKVLYFSSNRPGGYGGIDLYRTAMSDGGKLGTAYNMGSRINTSGNEMFPFVSGDGKLYFASDGHSGLGGLDVFVASKDTARNINIENLGYPINGSYDDFGLVFTSPEVGYFCSNRPGGKGDDDIYYFAFSPDARKKVQYNLVVYTQKNDAEGEDKPLAGVTVKMSVKDSVMHEFVSKPDGQMSFPVQTEKVYEFIASKKGFFTKRETFSTIGRTVPQFQLKDSLNTITFEVDLQMDSIILEKEIVLDNIYYDYNKADIRPDAARELDKLVLILKDNPEISIELGSHTDSRGNNDYNLRLSQRRAEAAVAHLLSKDISAERVTAIGYGEEKHIVEEAKTEEEHQLNRRTEFKVVKIKGKR